MASAFFYFFLLAESNTNDHTLACAANGEACGKYEGCGRHFVISNYCLTVWNDSPSLHCSVYAATISPLLCLSLSIHATSGAAGSTRHMIHTGLQDAPPNWPRKAQKKSSAGIGQDTRGHTAGREKEGSSWHQPSSLN